MTTTTATRTTTKPAAKRTTAKKPAAATFSAPIAEVHLVPIELIDVEEQIRKEFSQESIENLAGDIAERGLMSPILLNPKPTGRFTLISGERRLRAVKHNGQEGIPALLTKASNKEALLMQLAENIQREELSFSEEVQAVAKLYEVLGSLKEVAARVKKSVPWCSKRYSTTKRELHYLARDLLEEGHTEDFELLKAFSYLATVMPWTKGQEWANKVKSGEAGRKEIRAELKAYKDEQKKRRAEQEKEEQENKVSHAKKKQETPPPRPWKLEEAIEELDDCLPYWSSDKAFEVWTQYSDEQKMEMETYLMECAAHGKECNFERIAYMHYHSIMLTVEYLAILKGRETDLKDWNTADFLRELDSLKDRG